MATATATVTTEQIRYNGVMALKGAKAFPDVVAGLTLAFKADRNATVRAAVPIALALASSIRLAGQEKALEIIMANWHTIPREIMESALYMV